MSCEVVFSSSGSLYVSTTSLTHGRSMSVGGMCPVSLYLGYHLCS